MENLHAPEKRIWMWSAPRSRSTAIERSMMERKDMTVIEPSEPFINLYYNGPERRSNRNLHANTAQEPARLVEIVRLMLQNVMTPYVFSKNMAFYLSERFRAVSTRRLLEGGVNSFLIRDPRAALPSHFKQDHDFTMEEAGYGRLRQLFKLVTGSVGQKPIVIDGDDFCRAPERMMQKYCAAVEIPFDPTSMKWKAGQIPQFDGYGAWTENAEASTGFVPPPKELPDLVTLPPHIIKLIEKCRGHYEFLKQFAIRPNETPEKRVA
jgi:hypothetical protein